MAVPVDPAAADLVALANPAPPAAPVPAVVDAVLPAPPAPFMFHQRERQVDNRDSLTR